MYNALALLLVGIWLVIDSQEAPSTALTLIFGVAVGVLALVSLLPFLPDRRP